jgi:hypothetical protein
MRKRLTVAFVVLTIVLVVAAGLVRGLMLRDLIREQEAGHVRQETQLIASIVTDREAGGRPVSPVFLQMLVRPDARLAYDARAAEPVVVEGADYQDVGDDDLAASEPTSQGTVAVSQSPEVLRDVIGRDIGSLIVIFVLIAGVAGAAGFLIASALSRPFQRLAVAAGALGRGRFDLDLPNTQIPEARAISTALRTSALQLEDRIHRERAFAEHASHVLRTPLTGLRLELEDLTVRDDVPEDAKAAALRCLAGVAAVDAVAEELVQLTRGSLAAGSELPLRDLASQLSQRWADRLDVRDRPLTTAAEGDLSLAYTPGPVEHVTDLLLADVVRRGAGGVRIEFRGEDGGHLRIQVRSQDRSSPPSHADPDHAEAFDRVAEARTVVEALGGRVTGDHPADGIEVLLPRR